MQKNVILVRAEQFKVIGKRGRSRYLRVCRKTEPEIGWIGSETLAAPEGFCPLSEDTFDIYSGGYMRK